MLFSVIASHREGLAYFGNVHLKAKKQLSSVKARRGLYNYLFSVFFFSSAAWFLHVDRKEPQIKFPSASYGVLLLV